MEMSVGLGDAEIRVAGQADLSGLKGPALEAKGFRGTLLFRHLDGLRIADEQDALSTDSRIPGQHPIAARIGRHRKRN